MRALHWFLDSNALELSNGLCQPANTSTTKRPITMSTFSHLSNLLLTATLPLNTQTELPTEHIEPNIHAELTAHTKHFTQQIYHITNNVYSTIN